MEVADDPYLGFLAFHHHYEGVAKVEIVGVSKTELESIDRIGLRHLGLIDVDGLRVCGQILGVKGE